jgi:Fe-S cluster assembly iron-binding protein IscA
MTYNAVVDTEARDGDQEVYTSNGVRVVTDSFSLHFLNGLVIDFSNDLIKHLSASAG